nr:hypothetical protein [Tanacetum cinerariifolium]
MLHNQALPNDCYKVSIDSSLVHAACIPDIGNNGLKTVKDGVGGFFAWPKNQVVLCEVTPPTTIQKISDYNSAPKLQSKRKNYVSCETMQRQARTGKSHKSLNYDIFISSLEDFMVTYTEASPSPDYVSGLEHPPSPAYPLPAAVSHTTDSPGYIPESDPEEDPKENDEDPEKDPADYPTDRECEEEKEESSKDDANDEDEEEEEEEHPALADSVPPPVHHVTARMSVRAQTAISLPSKTKVARILAIPTLPPSPLSSLAAMIRLRAESPSTSHPLPSSTSSSGTLPLLPIPIPTSSPPLLLPSMSYRANVLEVTLPPQKRLCIALGLRFKVGKSSSAPTARPIRCFEADYGFIGTLDDEIRRDLKRERMIDFVTTVRQDTDEIYGKIDNAQDDRLLMSGHLNMLHRDRRAHARTARLMETKARISCEDWVQSMDASDTARVEVMSLQNGTKRTTISTLATTTTTTTTPPVTNTQLKALIDQGVTDALAAHDTDRSRNGKDSHNSRAGVRRQAPPAHVCTYEDFMKCEPLYFKGTEGVVEFT